MFRGEGTEMQHHEPAEMDSFFLSAISGTRISSSKTKLPTGEKMALKSKSNDESPFRYRSVFHQIK